MQIRCWLSDALSIVDLKLLMYVLCEGLTLIGICSILLLTKMVLTNLSQLLGEIWIVNYLEMIHNVYMLLISIIWCSIHLMKYVQSTIKE